MDLDVVILAAGQGTRMVSERPKVLHPLAGRPLLQHVIDTAAALCPMRVFVVIGHGADQVKDAVSGETLEFVLQSQQLGTGHAVAQALDDLQDHGVTLILYGDVPLVLPDTLRALVETSTHGALALLTAVLDDPTGYGRIVRDQTGAVMAIVEHKDASAQQRVIHEVNTGIMAVPTARLKPWIRALENSNAQGEYYLTDIIAAAVRDGVSVIAHPCGRSDEVMGVNNRAQLAVLERLHQARQAEHLMTNGVSLADPARFDIRGTVTHGQDVFIDINVVLEGHVSLGDRVRIGPNCVVKDAIIGSDVIVESHCVLDGCSVGDAATIGPFARLRPGTRLGARTKIGNFVETKNAVFGEGSKANHLSYVGDAEVGEHANIGAGTITCNYDGANKHRTRIGDHAFIGSNTALVAPVEVGANATVGAGSVVTQDVPDGALTVARAKQRTLSQWRRPTKKTGDQ